MEVSFISACPKDYKPNEGERMQATARMSSVLPVRLGLWAPGVDCFFFGGKPEG